MTNHKNILLLNDLTVTVRHPQENWVGFVIEMREQGEGFLPFSVHLTNLSFSKESVSENFFCADSFAWASSFIRKLVTEKCHSKSNIGGFIGEYLIHQAYLCSRGIWTTVSRPECIVASAVQSF